MANTDTVQLFKDDAGEWRWRRVAPNGRSIAVSGEGYHNLADAVHGFERAVDSAYVIERDQ